jgi:pimeloyl-ACP methyl ester carboxylesterase
MIFGKDTHYDGIVAFSQTDFTDDLKKITVSVLVMHSEDDQIVPYVASGPLSAKLLPNGTLKTYKDLQSRMVELRCFVLAVLASPFKSRRRLEAETYGPPTSVDRFAPQGAR